MPSFISNRAFVIEKREHFSHCKTEHALERNSPLLEFVRVRYFHSCRLDVNFHIPFSEKHVARILEYYEKNLNNIINRLKVAKLQSLYQVDTLANA